MDSYSNSSPRTRSKTPSSISSLRPEFAGNLNSIYSNGDVTASSGRNRPAVRVHGGSGGHKTPSEIIMDLQQQNEALRNELDEKERKLQYNINSIRTFWSPELKSEREIRKKEREELSSQMDKLRCSQDENQNLQLTVQALQDEIRAQRDLNQILQEDMSGTQMKDLGLPLSGYSVDTRILQEEVDRLSRENELLQRTMEEMESRIDFLKETLDAREVSLERVIQAIQHRDVENEESEANSLKMQLVESTVRQTQLDSLLMQRNSEIMDLKKDLSAIAYPADLPKIQSLQAIINVKDGKLAILERDLNLLEEEMAMMKRSGSSASSEREEDLKQLDMLKSHSTFMKNKIEQLKCDLQKKDTALATLQTKLDTLNNQQSDSRQHIDVLKESLAAKEQRAVVLQAEVDSLRTRLDEKQQILDRKQEQLSVMQEERSTSGSEVAHLQDTLEVKNRKLVVLQRKIESLGEVVKERDRQLELIKERMKNIQKDANMNDSALNTMEEALTEKEKLIKRLQSELKGEEEKWKTQLERFEQQQKNVIMNCNALKKDLAEKDTALSDLKEHASSLASSGLKKDSQIKQMEISLQQLKEKLTHSEAQLKKVEDDHKSSVTQAEIESNRVKAENEDKLGATKVIVQEKDKELKKCHDDLDRLLKILTETENEKHDKDRRLVALDRQVKDQQSRIKSLQDKMAEDAKVKVAAHNKDTAQFLTQIKMKDERIEELQLALRESVQMTADREDVLSKEQQNVRKLRMQQDEFSKKLKNEQAALNSTASKLSSTEEMLHQRECTIQSLLVERKKHMQELFDMKQESLLSAISEKDANIALLELSASKKRANQKEIQILKREKDLLVDQLKLQTQNSLLLMQDSYFDAAPDSGHQRPSSSHQTGQSHPSPNSNKNTSSPTEEEEGIWA